MSRIHEALKKAEQERGATPSPRPSTLADGIAIAPAAVSTSTVISGVAPGVAAGEIDPVPALSGDLLQSCVRREWKPDRSMLFFDKNVHDADGMEEFRTLRSRLYHMRETRPIKTILVGSAFPAEGKTYVAAHLAQVLARQHGRRTLLIDGDMRKPRLHECFGTVVAPGLADFLRAEIDVARVIQSGPLDGLYFIAAGSKVSNAAELVANGRLKQLIDTASTVFDWIIIDTPPILPVSDSVVMASCCDGILLVVQAAQTSFEVARRGIQEFRGAPMLGVVLNQVDARSGYTSYYSYRYGKEKSGTKA